MNQRTLIISVTALIAATVLGIVLWYVNMPKDTNTPPVTQTTNQTEKTPTVASSGETNTSASGETRVYAITQEDLDTSKWKTYRNEKYGFEVKYPEDLFDFKEIFDSNESATIYIIEKGYTVDKINRTIVLGFNQLHGEKSIIVSNICKTIPFKKGMDGKICGLFTKDELTEAKRRYDNFTSHGVCGGTFPIWFGETSYEDGSPHTFSSVSVGCDTGNPLEKIYKAIYDSIRFFPKKSSN